jgi:hypothetical protein
MNISSSQLRAAGVAIRGQQRQPQTVSVRRGMNGTEAAYAAHLGMRQLAGEIVGWKYEAVKLRIGEGCTYCPDFIVWLPDRTVEAHECKGFERDDSVVKFKAAAEMFPWMTFRMFKRRGQAWIETRTLNAREATR